MKAFVLSCIFILFCQVGLYAGQDGEGIRFFDGSFQEALDKAKRENKLVFVDFWATWCGPCRAMANTTFKEKEVGAFFNRHFVNVKVCVNSGDEGVRLGKEFDIVGYPTLMILNGDGFIVSMDAGTKKGKELIAFGEEALRLRSTKGIDERFRSGDRDSTLVHAYVKHLSLFQQFDKVERTLNQLFEERGGDFFDDVVLWRAFDACAVNPLTPLSRYFSSNYKKLYGTYGKEVVDNKIRDLYVGGSSVMCLFEIEQGYRMRLDTVAFRDRQASILKYGFPRAKELSSYLEFLVLAREKKYDEAVSLGNKFYKKSHAADLFDWILWGERLIYGKESREIVATWGEECLKKTKDTTRVAVLNTLIKSLRTMERPTSMNEEVQCFIRNRKNPF